MPKGVTKKSVPFRFPTIYHCFTVLEKDPWFICPSGKLLQQGRKKMAA